MGDNTFEYKLVITEIKQYHNGPGHLFAENILADITCPFSIFVDSSEAKQEDFTAKLTKKVETNKNKPDPKDVPAEQVDFRNQLKNRGSVKTKVDQKFKPQQVDFRTQLKNQGVKTKVLKQEELKEKSGKQLDFRNTLKKSVKTKTVEQDDLKRKSAEQKDFRNQLKKPETKPESKTVDETPMDESIAEPEVSTNKPEVNEPEPEVVQEPVEKPKSQEIIRNSETSKNSEEPEVPQTARTSTSSTNSANQRQDRKRKPKITKFPEEIVECKQDESFEIVLEVENADRVIWLIGDDEILHEPDDGVLLSHQGNEASLRVTNSLDDDSGLYTIICENDQGESRAQCNVIVRN